MPTTYPVPKDAVEVIIPDPIFTIPPPPPINQSPVVNAGSDVTITLPTNEIILSGVASDPDGVIVSSLWSQVAGGAAIIENPTNVVTKISGLTEGSYTFRIKVTDNKGATATDDTNVTVKPAIVSASGYEGYGKTTGGDTFPVVHVTNLNAKGAGSLYNAMGSNRRIVFDVGGVIKGFRFDVGNSESGSYQNLTIDGSTAPAPGITLDNTGAGGNTLGFEVSGNNVVRDIIIKYLRVINAGGDNIHLLGCSNVIVDHCTAYGAQDGNLDITESSKNITVSYCILGYGGNDGSSDKWSGNTLVAYGSGNITFHHNLFSCVTPNGIGERNPNLSNQSGTPGIVDVVNNLIWRWGRGGGTGSGYGTNVSHGSTANVRDNYYFSNAAQSDAIITDGHYGSYPKGNAYVTGNVSGNNLDINKVSNHAEYPIPDANKVTKEDACSAAKKVLSSAGVRYGNVPLSSVELSLVNQVTLTGCPL